MIPEPRTVLPERLPASERALSTDELFRAYATYVARLLTRMGVGRDGLDDAVQEVFLTAHRNGGYAPGPAKPSTYLARIAFQTALAERRRTRRSGARHSEQTPDELQATRDDPGRAVEASESLAHVERALEKLSPTLRATLWLADAEGESCVAIAEAQAVPVGTVYWRLDRARKQFRAALRRLDATGTRRGAFAFVLLPSLDGAWLVESRRLLAALRDDVTIRYDAVGGLARLEHALPTLSASSAPVATGALVGAKGLFALGAVSLSVLGALVLPPRETSSSAHAERPSIARRTPDAAAHLAALSTPEASPPATAFELTASRPLDVALNARRVARDVARTEARSARRAQRSGHAARPAEPDSLARTAAAERSEEPSALPTSARPDEPAPPSDLEPTPSEAAQIARGARLLRTDPRAALEAVRTLPALRAPRYLREERDYVEVMALLALGERAEGRARAEAFSRSYPSSALRRSIRDALHRAR